MHRKVLSDAVFTLPRCKQPRTVEIFFPLLLMKLLREMEGGNLSPNSPSHCNTLSYADQKHRVSEASVLVKLPVFLFGLG